MEKKNEKKKGFVEASQGELLFMRNNMPRGMLAMICHRTGATRSKVLYQIVQMPKAQNPDIIWAAREIFEAVTQMKYKGDKE